MVFEYDPKKSAGNKRKHGIDFEAAQALWEDPDAIDAPARTADEKRHMVIGRIGSSHWSAVVTYRGETIRLISVRRSRKQEIEAYENQSL